MTERTITEIVAPKINNNEDSVTLVQVLDNYQEVQAGELLGVVESTKATYEITAPERGVFYSLHRNNQSIGVGETLFLILPAKDADISSYLDVTTVNCERLISNKAAKLLKEYDIEPASVPGDGVISEQQVHNYIAEHFASDITIPNIQENSLLIYGAGDHAEVVYEAVVARGEYDVLGFMDYAGAPRRSHVFDKPVFAKFDLERLLEAGVKRVHVNTNDYTETKRVARVIREAGGQLQTVVHPSAVVADSAQLEENVFVGANAVVGTRVSIGPFTKVLNCASVAHHSSVGENTQISDGARLAGSVKVGSHCVVGLSSTVNMKLTVCDSVTIASGVNVYADITESGFITRD